MKPGPKPTSLTVPELLRRALAIRSNASADVEAVERADVLLEQAMSALHIVRFWPFGKPDIFAATYEAVSDAT